MKKPVTDPWIVIEPAGPEKIICTGIVHVTVPRLVGEAFVAFSMLVWGWRFVGVNVNVRRSVLSG